MIANKAELKTVKDNEHQINDFGIEEYVKLTALSKTSQLLIYKKIKNKVSKTNKVLKELEAKETIGISIVGQPNVGKSTLYNLLYGKKRVITAPISGTTRDSILSQVVYENYNFDLIDTAGLRKKNKISDSVDIAASYYSRKEIRYANCVILVIDGLKGISNQY